MTNRDHFLPEPERAEFLTEFLQVLVATGDLDNLAALGRLIHEWHATAEIRADPDLAARGDEYLLAVPVLADGEAVPPPT